MTSDFVPSATGVEDRVPAPAPRAGAGPWRAARRRRRVPLLAVGALLVIVCVLGYAYGAVRLGDRVQVLALARPVAAGQEITASDLTQVTTAKDPALRLIPVSQATSVLGHRAVVPLLAGTALIPAMLGDTSVFPPVGKTVGSLALKPGQYPQGLVSGARVAVYVSADDRDGTQASRRSGTSAASGAAGPTRLSGVVLSVDLAGDGQGATVVTVLVDTSDASKLAAAPSGTVVLMQTSAGGN